MPIPSAPRVVPCRVALGCLVFAVALGLAGLAQAQGAAGAFSLQILPDVAAADSVPAPAPVPEPESENEDCGGICFRPQGCPRCHVSVLLEFSVASSPERCGKGGYFSGEFGVLRNASPYLGLGLSAFLGGDDCGGRFGFRGRLRLWAHPQVGIDLAPGLVVDGDVQMRYPAFSGVIAVSFFGLLAPFLQVDQVRLGRDENWETYLGVRFESYAIVAGIGLLVAAFAGGG